MAVERLSDLLPGGVVSRVKVGSDEEDVVFIVNFPDVPDKGTVAVARSGKGPYEVWVKTETGGGKYVPVDIPEAVKILAEGETITLGDRTPINNTETRL